MTAASTNESMGTHWMAAGLLSLGLAFFAPDARAAGCSVSGNAVMGQHAKVYDAASGGEAIARFTGGASALSVSDFPASSSGRAKVRTGTGTGSVRIDGFVQASDIPIFTNRNVSVLSGHVWIGANRKVTVVGSAPGKLHVEKRLAAPMTGSFRAWAPCDALTLTQSVPPGWSPPGRARGYVVKKDQIELYSSARGSHVSTLNRAGYGPGILMWSTHRTGGWIHVEYHGEIVIDAWARARDLRALPPGETMDQLAPSTIRRGSPRLKVQGEHRVVKAQSEAAIRARAKAEAPKMGVVEVGAEVYVMDVVAGWASIMPTSLNVAPVGDSQFWVLSTDLGL